MDAALEHVALQQCLVPGAAIGAVSPDIAGGVVRVDHPAQLAPVAVCRRGHRGLADKPIALVDADMRLVAEHWRSDLRQRRPVGTIADLAPDLHRPACIDILLMRLVGLATPDLLRRLARLDRGLLALGVALLGRGHQRCIDDLTAHRQISSLAQLLLERLHQRLERPALGKPVAIVADGVLVGHRAAKVEAEEAHPAQAIPDHELHARIRQIMLRLNHQHLEHRHRTKGRSAALGPVAIAEPVAQKRSEAFELHRARQNLQRNAVLAQPHQVLRKRKQAPWVHQTSPSNASFLSLR